MNILSIQRYLEKIGLSEIESKLYLGLLEMGSSTVLELARKLKMKRATVHFNVESLIQKGLISQAKMGARRHIVAESPDTLVSILDDKISEISKLNEYLPNIVKMIYKTLPDSKENNSDNVYVKYYEDSKGLKSLYEEFAQSDEVYSYINYEKLLEIYPKFPSVIAGVLRKNDVKIKEIIHTSQIPTDYISSLEDGYEYKLVGQKKEVSSIDSSYQFIINDTKIGIISKKTDTGTPFGTIISNIHITDASKALFKLLWSSL